MVLLPHFHAKEFRGSFTQQMNIVYLCLSYRDMKDDTSPFLVERLPRTKLDFILVFIFNVSQFLRSVCFGDCDALSVSQGISRESIQV